MPRVILIIFILNFYNVVFSSTKNEIIYKLKQTKNLSFDFIQTINEKNENGSCIIEYPKKIYCTYNNLNQKIIVSNGKSLVIKNTLSNQYYIYPLKKTPLNLILDKNFLINQIKKLEPRIIDNKYLNFTIIKEDYEVNLFFNNKTLNLIGWQTQDIYQNLVITFISKIKINRNIDQSIFKLPSLD